jgi:hypothetical protein
MSNDFEICPECGAIVTGTRMVFYQIPDPDNRNRLLNLEKGIFDCGHDDPNFPARSTSWSYYPPRSFKP